MVNCYLSFSFQHYNVLSYCKYIATCIALDFILPSLILLARIIFLFVYIRDEILFVRNCIVPSMV